MTASLPFATILAEKATVLSTREALTRLIDYARIEAEREGETACADLLFAALISLEVPLTEGELWATLSGLGKRLPS